MGFTVSKVVFMTFGGSNPSLSTYLTDTKEKGVTPGQMGFTVSKVAFVAFVGSNPALST